METLGIWLRRAREEKGIGPSQVESATRIRPRFLEMLETGNFSALPGGDMQARGFLRVYSRYLGLPTDEVIARYEVEFHGITLPGSNGGSAAGAYQALAARPAPGQVPQPKPVASSVLTAPAARRWGAAEKLMVAGLSFIGVLLAVVAVTYYLSQRTGDTSLAETLIPEPTEASPRAAAQAQAGEPAVTPTFAIVADGTVALTLEATEHTWVHVTSDNQTVFRGILSPAEPQTWTGQQIVLVETGNGAGLRVTVNEQLQGPMGERGKVARRAWTPFGEVEAPPLDES
jgi:cytoskeleton protein RodZ